MSEWSPETKMGDLASILERIEMDLVYLLNDANHLHDAKLAAITDKIEIASLCISSAVRSLRDTRIN